MPLMSQPNSIFGLAPAAACGDLLIGEVRGLEDQGPALIGFQTDKRVG